jgi:membrane protein required for colicin V production
VNAIDYLILIVLGVSTLSSLMRGLITEVMSLVVWALALYASSTLSGAFANSFLTGVTEPTLRLGSSYLIVFLGVLILGGLVTWSIRKLVLKTGLSGTDRLLGAMFGFARGLLMVFSAALFAGFTPLPTQPIWQQSALMPTISNGARAFGAYLPPAVRNYLHYPKADEQKPDDAPLAPSETPAASKSPSAQ